MKILGRFTKFVKFVEVYYYCYNGIHLFVSGKKNLVIC